MYIYHIFSEVGGKRDVFASGDWGSYLLYTINIRTLHTCTVWVLQKKIKLVSERHLTGYWNVFCANF